VVIDGNGEAGLGIRCWRDGVQIIHLFVCLMCRTAKIAEPSFGKFWIPRETHNIAEVCLSPSVDANPTL